MSLMSERGIGSDDGQWALAQKAAAIWNRCVNGVAYFPSQF